VCDGSGRGLVSSRVASTSDLAGLGASEEEALNGLRRNSPFACIPRFITIVAGHTRGSQALLQIHDQSQSSSASLVMYTCANKYWISPGYYLGVLIAHKTCANRPCAEGCPA
jgi:hypothetical protein